MKTQVLTFGVTVLWESQCRTIFEILLFLGNTIDASVDAKCYLKISTTFNRIYPNIDKVQLSSKY